MNHGSGWHGIVLVCGTVLTVVGATWVGLRGTAAPLIVAGLALAVLWLRSSVGWWSPARVRDYGEGRDEVVLWGLAITTIVAANVYSPAEVDATQRALASATILLSALPTALWLRGRDVALPFLPIFGAIYGMYYAWAILLRQAHTRTHYIDTPIPDEALNKALLLALGALIAGFVSYYAVGATVEPVKKTPWLLWWDEARASRWLVPIGLIGLGAYGVEIMVTIPDAVAMPVNLGGDLSIFAAVGLFVLWQRRGLPPGVALFLWTLLIPGRTLLGFSTGANLQGAELPLALVLAGAATNRRVRWSIPIVGLALLVLLEPAKTAYRAETGAEPGTPVAAVAGYGHTTAELLLSGDYSVAEALDAFMSRVGYIMEFAVVASLTPERVPYWKGETYKPLLTKPIPRVIFPDKPEEATGQEFGHRYSFLQPTDTRTSYNMPQLVELYSNFGAVAVVAGMAVFGAMYRLLVGWLLQGQKDVDTARITAAAFVMSQFLLLEGAFSQVASQAGYRVLLAGGLAWGVRRVTIDGSRRVGI